jgi:hypothetical protein
MGLINAALPVFALLRFGLLGGISFGMVYGLLVLPITFQPSAWYAPGGYAVLLVIAAITLYGFRTSLGSRRMLELGVD